MAFGSSSAKENPDPLWARWALPSICDLIFVALLASICFSALSVRLLGDAGIGWHIRTGQIILSTRSIPRADPFSSLGQGHPLAQNWFAWEWLYDVLVGALDQAAGLNGVVWLTALLISCTFSWVFSQLLRRKTDFVTAIVLLMLALTAASIHFLARPHVVSWLFTLVWFLALDSFQGIDSSRIKKLWLLPLLIILWVNLHGGFLVAFVLLAAYWIEALLAWSARQPAHFEDVLEKARARNRFLQLTLLSLASAVATLINPYGWRLHLHIYRYLTNRFLMDHIDEFQSPNFHQLAPKCFALLLLITLAALAAKKFSQPLRISQLLIMLFAVYSGLYSARNIPVSALLLILIVAPRLSAATKNLLERSTLRRTPLPPFFATSTFLERMQSLETSRQGRLWPLAAVLLTAWIALHSGTLGSKQVMTAHFDPNKFPAAALDYLQRQQLPGPILAPDNWGGYLIYRLDPGRKVILDDRHDFYGADFLKSYLQFIHAETDWQRFLQQHPPGCIVMPQNSPAASILAESPNWQTVYSDKTSAIFLPRK
jgi:hypothetical protein